MLTLNPRPGQVPGEQAHLEGQEQEKVLFAGQRPLNPNLARG
jgi:hypothetical protein